MEIKRDRSKLDDDFKARFHSFSGYLKMLMAAWDGKVSLSSSRSTGTPTCIIAADASGKYGKGAMCVTSSQYAMAKWTSCDIKIATKTRAVSSTVLEMMNIADAIATFARGGDSVLIFSDSEGAVRALQKKYLRGSKEIQAIIVRLDLFILRSGINVVFKFIEREDPWIQICDSLSRDTVFICSYGDVVGSKNVGGLWVEADSVQKSSKATLLV